jgi:hypothetical protein
LITSFQVAETKEKVTEELGQPTKLEAEMLIFKEATPTAEGRDTAKGTSNLTNIIGDTLVEECSTMAETEDLYIDALSTRSCADTYSKSAIYGKSFSSHHFAISINPRIDIVDYPKPEHATTPNVVEMLAELNGEPPEKKLYIRTITEPF